MKSSYFGFTLRFGSLNSRFESGPIDTMRVNIMLWGGRDYSYPLFGVGFQLLVDLWTDCFIFCEKWGYCRCLFLGCGEVFVEHFVSSSRSELAAISWWGWVDRSSYHYLVWTDFVRDCAFPSFWEGDIGGSRLHFRLNGQHLFVALPTRK